MLLRSLIGLCVILTLALIFQSRGRAVPPPVSNFDPNQAKRLMAYRFPDEYYPLGSIDDDYDGPVDSVSFSSSEVAEMLKIFLNGMNYASPAYTFFKTGDFPESYSMAGCHYPRFIVTFKDSLDQVSNNYSICFECGNAFFSNGTRFPRSGSYPISVEGGGAFRSLQDRLFPK